jgi:membrane-bound lytic murein transglycosylase A
MIHQTMNTSRHSASKASSSSNPIHTAYRAGAGRAAAMVLIAMALLAGCAQGDAPAPPQPPAPATLPLDLADSSTAPLPIDRPGARWHPATWADLPGWPTDRTIDAWTALRRSCERPAPGWERACADAAQRAPADDASARAWLVLNMGVYRVESMSGAPDGLITGYFEPLVDARRTRGGGFTIPLHTPPDDLAGRSPYYSRRQLDTLPAARSALKGREIAFVADPLDALVLQIQGSGRLRITEPDGRIHTVRLAYAAHNGHNYASVGRWLIDRGEMRAEAASWLAIRDWARRHPRQVNDMLWSNPRVVFFREEPLPDPELGPKGAQGVPLTPGRSIAVDPRSIPYGTLVWLDTTEPLSATPLQRLVVAQDTGSAIVGAVRADYFWGWAGDAEAQAGRMKQPLRMWVLWPKS